LGWDSKNNPNLEQLVPDMLHIETRQEQLVPNMFQIKQDKNNSYLICCKLKQGKNNLYLVCCKLKQSKSNLYLLCFKKTKYKNFNFVQKILKLKSYNLAKFVQLCLKKLETSNLKQKMKSEVILIKSLNPKIKQNYLWNDANQTTYKKFGVGVRFHN